MILTWLLIPLTFLIPLIDSTKAPYFDLTQPFSQFAYWISRSGGKYGVPFIAMTMLVLLISRDGISFQRRWKEAGIIILIMAICAGGGAFFNEHFIKEQLKVPRPNIVWLAGENGSGPLGMTAKEFYEIGNIEARHEPLAKILAEKPLPLSPAIEEHWIEATGYTFPSGHSFSAMFFATLFLLLATTYLTTKRLWVFYLLLPWALAVCYSRPILRVHTPTDISVGSFQGLLIGFLAWLIVKSLIRIVSKNS
jgi:phosphatidylglycerophosphatase B